MPKPMKIGDVKEERMTRLLERNKSSLDSVKKPVLKILREVKEKGDEALLKYTKLHDGTELSKDRLRVTETEISEAYRKLSKEILHAMRKASRNIRKIHQSQLPKERILEKSGDILVKQVFRPVGSVGLYIPGGRFPYPSTALMLGIPARVAGVRRLVACSPPTTAGDVNPAVLVALDMAGVDEVYRVGGVQAVGAMAYGTETVAKVDKVLGPGNIYVTAAKILVYGEVGIDFPAGPTEIVIFADETADPSIVVADMLSQAEHDPFSVAVLVTTSKGLAYQVGKELGRVLVDKVRSEIVVEAIRRYGTILTAESVGEAVDFINKFAPEHLEIIVKRPRKLIPLIENVGSVSVGNYTPVAATDYAVGSSHVLPTGGAARYHSGITVYDFMKTFNVHYLTKLGLKKLKGIVDTLSEVEGLVCHADSVYERFKPSE